MKHRAMITMYSRVLIVRNGGDYFHMPESTTVRIYSHFGWFGLVKIAPHIHDMSTEINKNVILEFMKFRLYILQA